MLIEDLLMFELVEIQLEYSENLELCFNFQRAKLK